MLVSRKEILSTVGKWKLSKNDVSCLSSVKIAICGNKIGFYSNMLNFQYDAEFKLDSFESDFIQTVFFPDLLKALKSSKEKQAEILVEADRLLIDGIPVKFTDNTDKMPEEFRLGEKIEDIYLQKDELTEIRDMIFPHCSDDETRYFMNGICIESKDNELNFVATNGRTLARKQFLRDFDNPQFNVIVPVNFLPKFAHDTIILVYEKYTVFFSRNLDENSWEKFTVKNIDGQFPNYRRVIPENNNQNFEVVTAEFLEVLKKIKPFAEKDRKIIVKHESGKVTVSAGEVQFSMPAETTDEFEFAVNVDYLIMSVSKDSAKTKICHCGQAMKAITLQENNLLRIIMPMQID